MRHQREGYLARLRSVYLRKHAEGGTRSSPVVRELYKELRRELVANKSRKYYHRHKEGKVKARPAVISAIRRGDLSRPSVCSRCGASGEVEAHHSSYEPDHWLDVEWLCLKCHRQIHGGRE